MVKGRRFVSQRLMRTAGVIPIDPLADRAPGFLKTAEIVLPNAFLLQAPKKAFYDAVLFRCVRRDKLLCQFIVPAGLSETSALEHKTVIAADDRHGSVRTQRAETFDAGIFQRPLRFSGSSTEGKFETDQFAVTAVDDSNEVPPSVGTARDMRHVSRPTPIGHGSLAATCLDTWPGAAFAIPDLPAIGSNDAVDGALRHNDPISEA